MSPRPSTHAMFVHVSGLFLWILFQANAINNPCGSNSGNAKKHSYLSDKPYLLNTDLKCQV
jgi:hypothetical protein